MHTSSPFLVNDFLKIEHMQDVHYLTLETRYSTVSGLETMKMTKVLVQRANTARARGNAPNI